MAIYDEIGGADAVAAAVEEFYGRVLGDPALAPHFDGIAVPRLKAHQRAFIGAALGGPAAYEGRSMGEAHAGLGVSPEAFALVVGHLVATLEHLGVPADTIGRIGGALAPLEDEIVGVRPSV